MSSVDGGNEYRFDRAEGCRMEVFGEFVFVGVIAKNAVGLVSMGTC